MKHNIYLLLFSGLFFACNSSPSTITTQDQNSLTITDSSQTELDSLPVAAIDTTPVINIDSILGLADSAWVDLSSLLPKARFDIRYATTNNFMELQVYDCPACFTRLEVAKALMKVQTEIDSLGLVLKFFDCYRPSSAQWALWKKKPDARYVHPPKLGSMHSRGNALDLTLVVDSTDQELDMGTAFDYFGKEAYWNYKAHSAIINQNRQLLREVMYANRFKTVSTEWWHFAYQPKRFPLSNMQWNCE